MKSQANAYESTRPSMLSKLRWMLRVLNEIRKMKRTRANIVQMAKDDTIKVDTNVCVCGSS